MAEWAKWLNFLRSDRFEVGFYKRSKKPRYVKTCFFILFDSVVNSMISYFFFLKLLFSSSFFVFLKLFSFINSPEGLKEYSGRSLISLL